MRTACGWRGLQRVRGGLGGVESCAGNDAEDERGGDGEEQGGDDGDADCGPGSRDAGVPFVSGRALRGDESEAKVISRG